MIAAPEGKKGYHPNGMSRSHFAAYLFIGPALLAIIALIIYPLLYGVYLSFFNTNLVNKWEFVQFRYYIQALTGTDFYKTVLLTFRFMLLVVLGHFLIGYLLAGTLNKEFPGRLIFRIIFMLPWLFPETVVALLFSWIFNPVYGVVNTTLKGLGIIRENISFFGSGQYAFYSTVFVCIWKGFPLVMTMILAGMQSVPEELYEAARIDGANRRNQTIHVTIPTLKPVLATTLILDSVWWFKQYTLVNTLTGGGPGTATSIISLSVFKTAFESLRFGKASAMAVLVFFLCFGMSKIYRAVLKDGNF